MRAHGAYRGYCSLGIVFQTLENAGLRRSLGMGGGMSGVLVNRVQPTSPAAAALRKGDVLLAFDGVPIANDGTVHFRQRERIFFTSLITQKPTGAAARLRVLRAGAALEFDVPLQPLQTLVPICKYDEVPSFLVYAGLCFVPLSQVIYARGFVVVVVTMVVMIDHGGGGCFDRAVCVAVRACALPSRRSAAAAAAATAPAAAMLSAAANTIHSKNTTSPPPPPAIQHNQ